jgi:hypothetical protein
MDTFEDALANQGFPERIDSRVALICAAANDEAASGGGRTGQQPLEHPLQRA